MEQKSFKPCKAPLLLAAPWFPPIVSGSAILNRNLWAEWPANDLIAVSFRPADAKVDPALALTGIRTELVDPWPFRGGRAAAHLDPLAAKVVMRKLLEVADGSKPRAIWANWPSTAFLLGAWRAACLLRLPLYIHMHDMWREAYIGKRLFVERLFATVFERRVMHSAARLFTITEEARGHYQAKLGLDSYVLPHSVPEADLGSDSDYLEAPAKPVLHFAGAIYSLMNADAIVNVVRALDLYCQQVTLDCFTPASAASMAAIGICGPRVRLRFAPKKEVMASQRASSIVLLPLAFRSSNPLEIRTVFPTKLLEYLICGRPILVHAPADSWASRNARLHGWGEVVDVAEPAAVAAGIENLLKNPERQRWLVANALAEARRRASPQVVRDLRLELARLEARR